MAKKKEIRWNEYVELSPSELIPYENNPRLNAAAVDYLANSIDKLTFGGPILVDDDMVIVAGHTRLQAAMKLGLKKVPTVILHGISKDQAKAMRLADNKVPESSTWDLAALDIELDGLKDVFDMEDFGFLDQKYEMFDAEDIEEDDAPERAVEVEKSYGVLVECASEDEQREFIERMVNEGRSCRKM